MFQAPKEKIISSLQIFGHTITEMYSMTEDEIQLVVFDCEGNFDSEVVFK